MSITTNNDGCKKVTTSDPGEGAVVWHTGWKEYVILGEASVRWAKTARGREQIHLQHCQTHEDRVKEARDNLNKAIEAYTQITSSKITQTKE